MNARHEIISHNVSAQTKSITARWIPYGFASLAWAQTPIDQKLFLHCTDESEWPPASTALRPRGRLMPPRRRRLLMHESLEKRLMLAADWQNPLNQLDIDADGVVAPRDVLLIVNELNSRRITNDSGDLPDRGAHQAAGFLDVSGDEQLTPIDALLVINALNGDSVAPVVTASLLNDTAPDGLTNSDLVTSDPMIQGIATDDLTGISVLQAEIDGNPATSVVVAPNGSFAFDPDGGGAPLSDGLHVVRFVATDALTNQSQPFDLEFTLDRTSPSIDLESPGSGTLDRGARLAGSVDGTGSAIHQLRHRLDDLPNTTVIVDGRGTFNRELFLASLDDGDHSLTLTAQDLAGNTTQQEVDVVIDRFSHLATITANSPLNGAVEVGVRVHPQVFFSKEVDGSTLNEDNFYATFGGEKLPAQIVAAEDASFAWLFIDDAMPDRSRVEITVDGSSITSADGSGLLDADGDGQGGGTHTFAFSTGGLTPVPGTTLEGVIADPGPDLLPWTSDDVSPGPDGLLHTPDDIHFFPIPGVEVFLLGLENNVVTTDSEGRFLLDQVPSGNVKIVTNGLTAGAPSDAPGVYFPEMVMDATMSGGVTNFTMPGMEYVHLPRIRSAILNSIDGRQRSSISANADGGFGLTVEERERLRIEVPANSLIAPDGSSLESGQIGLSTVPPELVRDMLPPGVLEHTFDITVQAPGISNFSTPAPMTFPNVFSAEPGTQLNFLSFDHTTGQLVIEGTVTVSEDGLTAATDPGFGITHPGWHGMTPPGTDMDGGGGVGGTTDTEPSASLGDLFPDTMLLAPGRGATVRIANTSEQPYRVTVDTKHLRAITTNFSSDTYGFVIAPGRADFFEVVARSATPQDLGPSENKRTGREDHHGFTFV